MKKTLKSLLCILMTLLLLAPLPSAVAEAKQTSGEDELIWSNLNPAAVKNGPTKDEPVIIAGTIMIAIVFTIVMLLVDVLYAFVDPRIKAKYAGTKGK